MAINQMQNKHLRVRADRLSPLHLNVIISSSHRNWVLGILARELKNQLVKFQTSLVYIPQSRRDVRSPNGFLRLPKADVNIYLHHELALTAISKKWMRQEETNVLFFTHLAGDTTKIGMLKNHFQLIIVNNSSTKRSLGQLGFDEKLIHVLHNPIDPIFRTYQRDKTKLRDIIFVSNYTQRKRPDLIVEVVQRCHDFTFTLLGRGWNGGQELAQIANLPNFNYREFNFETYPYELSKHKVFCSLSDVEGGPVPLLEALVLGLNVVVTDTGSARDLLPSSIHSTIIPVNPEVDAIIESLTLAVQGMKNNFIPKDEFFYPGFAEQMELLIDTERFKNS